MNKKITLDYKLILIIILILSLVVFGIYHFKSSEITELEFQNQLKQTEINDLQIERDSLENERDEIDNKYEKIKQDTLKVRLEIKEKNQEIYRKKIEISEIKESIKLFDEQYRATIKQIEEIEKNPIKVKNNKLVDELSKNFKNS